MTNVNWDRIADDYCHHRQGYPDRFYAVLTEEGVFFEGARILDLGAGTLDVARGLARRGATAFAVEPSGPMVRAGVGPSAWAWFDRERAGPELRRVCRVGAFVALVHYVWVPMKGSPAELTHELLSGLPSGWNQAKRPGIFPEWIQDLERLGLDALWSRSFDLLVPYSRAGWRGRIRASVPVGASLTGADQDRFDREHDGRLSGLTEPLQIPHRVFLAVGRRSESGAPSST